MKQRFTVFVCNAVIMLFFCSQVAGANDLAAGFEADKFFVSPGEAVQFTNKSEGDINEWSWHFGDGSRSFDWNPTKQYTYTGTYSVTLTLTSTATLTDTLTKDSYITVAQYSAQPAAERAVSGRKVAITATPSDNDNSYAVEEGLPEGLSPANISNDGQWRQDYRRIQWGPFYDVNPRTLTYTAVGPDGAHALEGVIRIDGEPQLTSGDNEISLAAERLVLNGTDQEIDIFSDQRIIGTGAAETLNIAPGINVDFTAGHGDHINLPYGLEHYEITSIGNHIWFSDTGANKVVTIIVTGNSTVGFPDESTAATLEMVFSSGGPPQVQLGGAVVGPAPLDHDLVEL